MSSSTGSRKAKAFEITARVAYREFEATFRPPPKPHEACALVARFLPGRHWCGASVCPPACPKYAPPAGADLPAMSEGCATIVSGTTTGTPEIMRDLDDDDPDDDLDQHVPERPLAPPEPPPEPVEAPPASPAAAARAAAATPRARQKAPPCLRCGAYRPIMAVMAGGPGGPAFTLCSRCYRFADVGGEPGSAISPSSGGASTNSPLPQVQR
jgi:hypothetical protein